MELFFLRLLRGAGGEGLAGMKWRCAVAGESENLTRPPAARFFKRVSWRNSPAKTKSSSGDDATNFSSDFLRNRIRNELLPLLRKNYQPGIGKTVLRLMEIVGAESDFVGEAAQNAVSSLRPAPVRPQAEHYSQLPVAVQRRVLQSQLVSLGLAADFDLIESLRQSADVAVSVGSQFSVLRDQAGKVALKKIQTLAGFNPDELAVNLAGGAGE